MEPTSFHLFAARLVGWKMFTEIPPQNLHEMFALKQKVSFKKIDGKSRCNSIELDFKSSIKLLYLPWFEPKKTSTKQGLQNSNPPKNHFKKNGCSVTPMLFPCKKNGVHFCWVGFYTLLNPPKKNHRRGGFQRPADLGFGFSGPW